MHAEGKSGAAAIYDTCVQKCAAVECDSVTLITKSVECDDVATNSRG